QVAGWVAVGAGPDRGVPQLVRDQGAPGRVRELAGIRHAGPEVELVVVVGQHGWGADGVPDGSGRQWHRGSGRLRVLAADPFADKCADTAAAGQEAFG